MDQLDMENDIPVLISSLWGTNAVSGFLKDQSSAWNNIAIYSYGFFPEIVITEFDIDTPDVWISCVQCML